MVNHAEREMFATSVGDALKSREMGDHPPPGISITLRQESTSRKTANRDERSLIPAFIISPSNAVLL
ncbi:MAG: hypothetical protein EA367_04705 [Leptolyngbya sp. DLM2.Bin15]|nr:MAG: hypothetical protein EA367_04705 [Leptolyngbya sp. DLM2.Bin15]